MKLPIVSGRTGSQGATVPRKKGLPLRLSGRASWLSRDLIAENGSINLYAYVLNDPINYWDSLGLYPNINFLSIKIYNNCIHMYLMPKHFLIKLIYYFFKLQQLREETSLEF